MTIWAGTPKKRYIITTDQGTAEIDRDYLNYKATIAALKAKGYTNIRITYIGRHYTY